MKAVTSLNANVAHIPPRSFSDLGRAEHPRKIAIVYNRTPIPMRRADQMTVAHLISFLKARGHEVDLYALRTGAVMSAEDEAWLKANTNQLHLQSHSWFDAFKGLMGGLLRGLPLQVGLFQNSKLKHRIATAVHNGEYDYVYVYYFRSAEAVSGLGSNLPSKTSGSKTPTFLALQLSQTLNTRRIRDNAPNIANRVLYRVESELVRRYETRIWREFTHTILIGKDDLEAINKEASLLGRPLIEKPMYSAHGTDVERFRPRSDIEVVQGRVVFSGVMRTPTNVQAVLWFVEKVWPTIRTNLPDATFMIVGREPAPEIRALASEELGIEVTGTVSDPSELIASAAVCVNPMQAGGGMQNKLIEYLASQKPVVATSVANEGIQAPSESIRIEDHPDDFARAVVELLEDQATAQVQARKAREFALSQWTWEHHFLLFEESIEKRLSEVN